MNCRMSLVGSRKIRGRHTITATNRIAQAKDNGNYEDVKGTVRQEKSTSQRKAKE